jgi:hypothetical protein
MTRRIAPIAPIAALAVGLAAIVSSDARAAEAPLPVSAFARPSPAVEELAAGPSAVDALVPVATPVVPASLTPAPIATEALVFGPRRPVPRNDAVRYRPRYGRRSAPAYSSPAQLHAGFFEPDGDGGTFFVAGLRGGPQVSPNIQLGVGVEWWHNSEKTRTVTGEPYEQGGTTVIPERVLSRASADVLPFTGFIQFTPVEDGPVLPYFGAAFGYQLLFLNAEDFQTGIDYDATFGGWGWNAWGGIALPLSGQSRLTGEVFVAGSEMEREVTDPFGFDYRERVELEGVGMRFGLSWGF